MKNVLNYGVHGNGQVETQVLQDLIDNAEEGEVVLFPSLKTGRKYVLDKSLILRKSIRIQGETANVILEQRGNEPVFKIAPDLSSQTIVVEHLTLLGGTIGIYVSSSTGTDKLSRINRIKIFNTSEYAIKIEGNLEGNVFSDVEISGSPYAVHAISYGSNKLNSCVFSSFRVNHCLNGFYFDSESLDHAVNIRISSAQICTLSGTGIFYKNSEIQWNNCFFSGNAIDFYSSGSSTISYQNFRHNLSASTDPSVNDDASKAYCVGSEWYNLNSSKIFFCLSPNIGSAVWKDITLTGTGGSPGSGGDHGDLTGLGDDDHLQYYHLTGTRALSGNLDVGGYNIVSANLINGINISSHASRHLSGGLDPLPVATSTISGLFSSSDKSKLDGIETGAQVVTSARVDAAGAIMQLHISGTEGFVRKSGSAYETFKTNLVSNSDPTINDDSLDGYKIGSIWINVLTDHQFICLDDAVGNAVWKITTFSGVIPTVHSQLLSLTADDHPQYLHLTGSRPLSGNLDMGGFNIVSVGLVDGVDISTHVHPHGNQTDPAHHAVVTTIANGFMSSSDKSKLDTIDSNAKSDHGNLTGLADDDHLQYLHISGTRGMSGTLNMNGHNITNAGTINSISITAHASRHNPDGADQLATSAPHIISSSNVIGTSASFSRADHIHDHGNQSIPTHHAVATTTANGFFSSSDKTKLDGIEAGAQVVTAARVDSVGSIFHTDFSGNNPGFVIRTAAETYTTFKYTITGSDPGVGHDSSLGYSAGSRWFNTSSLEEFVCLTNSIGASDWKSTTNQGGAATDHGTLSGLMDDDHPQYLHVSGTRNIAGHINFNGFQILTASLINGINVSASFLPYSISSSAAIGTSSSLARTDHVHAHGDQTVASLHAVATTTANGFFSSSDKSKLDGIEVGAQITNTARVDAAGALMHTDISGTDSGFITRINSETYRMVRYMSTGSNPGTGHDSSQGFDVGSRWYNTSSLEEFVCLTHSVGGASWKSTTLTGGAAGQGANPYYTPISITMFAESGALWINQPAALTEFMGNTRNRVKIELFSASMGRLLINCDIAGQTTATYIGAQFSTDQSNWFFFSGSQFAAPQPTGSINPASFVVTNWVPLTSTMKQDVFIRLVGSGGNGTVDPRFGAIHLQFK